MTVSKNTCIDKLDDIVNKYNNTYHRTIKIKPVDRKHYYDLKYIGSSIEINDEDPKFKIGDMLEYQNIKIFLQKAMSQIGLKKFLWLKKLKTLSPEHLLLVVLKTKKFLFCKNELQKTNQREFRVEWREKAINYILNQKAAIVLLIVGLIKKC